MSASWSIGRVLSVAGQEGPLRILDHAHGPHRRIVCVIHGYLEWWVTPDRPVRLLDGQDAGKARLIAAAPGLVEWAARTGGWEAHCWQDAHAVLSRPRDPRAEG